MTDDLTEVIRPEVMEALVELRNSRVPGAKITDLHMVPTEFELAQFPQFNLYVMEDGFYLIENRDYA